MTDNSKAVKYGTGTASNHDLAKALVLAALHNKDIPYSVVAMMSEASARLDPDAWTEGVSEWSAETKVEILIP